MFSLSEKNNTLLALCTVLHFTVDGVCAAVLTSYAVHESDYSNIFYYFWLYNFIAFGGQWLTGIVLDKYRKIIVPILAVVPLLLGIGLLNIPILCRAVSIAVANCLFHVAAGILILERYGNFREPGIFVSSGAVGLGLGLNRIMGAVTFEIICAVFTAMTLFILIKQTEHQENRVQESESETGENFPLLIAGALLLLVCVILRGFGGNSRLPVHVMLMPCVFMLGKSVGGIVCDILGCRKTILAVLILSFGALQIKGTIGAVVLAFAFNMTMPLTLRLLHWYFPEHPGLTFGLAAGCLLPGAFLKSALKVAPEVMVVIQFISLFMAGVILQRYGRNKQCLSIPHFSQH